MTTATRIGINIMFLVFGVLMMAQMLGLLPDGAKEKLASRISLSESIAVQSSIAANRKADIGAKAATKNNKYREIYYVLKSLVDRNDEVVSAGLRLKSGLMVSVGPHEELWNHREMSGDAEHISVPIVQNKNEWGTIEVCFVPLYRELQFLGFNTTPLWMAMIAITAAAGLGSIFYYSRIFKEEDNRDERVPSRVRSALDSLSDGLLVLNEDEEVVFANRAFEEATGIKEKELLGTMVSDLNWSADWDELISKEISEDEARKITLRTPIGGVDFTVGSSEILDDNGEPQGKLICFNDVTILEKRREELMYTMRSLQSSRDMIKEQNEQLKILATRDPLTNCWNRRSFFDEFYPLWKEHQSSSVAISAIMLDIDHFKSVNDNHGHAMGDEVLKRVSAAILELKRESDIVCRYGGEEFCILLPKTNLADAKAMGERLRRKIEGLEFENLSVTASQGVSSSNLKAAEPEEMLEQADQALYFAKRSGRNRVVCFNELPADFDLQEIESHTRKHEKSEENAEARAIPFQVVSSMMSVLNHRDPSTAAHCVASCGFEFRAGTRTDVCL